MERWPLRPWPPPSGEPDRPVPEPKVDVLRDDGGPLQRCGGSPNDQVFHTLLMELLQEGDFLTGEDRVFLPRISSFAAAGPDLLKEEKRQPDVVRIELRIAGNDAVGEAQDTADLIDVGVLFCQKGAGANRHRFRERAEGRGGDGLVDEVVECRFADQDLERRAVRLRLRSPASFRSLFKSIRMSR